MPNQPNAPSPPSDGLTPRHGRYAPQHSARNHRAGGNGGAAGGLGGGLPVATVTRHWPRRVLIATNIVVAILLLGAASVYGYVTWRFGQINRIHIGSLFGGADGVSQPMTI